MGRLSEASVTEPPAVALVAPQPQGDTLDSLLRLLASLYRVHPMLWLDPRLRCLPCSPCQLGISCTIDNGMTGRFEMLGAFMEYIGRVPIVEEAPAVMVAYLEVLSALAEGEQGSIAMFQQLCLPNAPPAISWKRLFDVMTQYCSRYAAGGGVQRVGLCVAESCRGLCKGSSEQPLAAGWRWSGQGG